MADEPPISEADLRQALTEATAAFRDHGVKYALIGGLAISHRSQPRFTKDVDFLVNVSALTLPLLLEDLQSVASYSTCCPPSANGRNII